MNLKTGSTLNGGLMSHGGGGGGGGGGPHGGGGRHHRRSGRCLTESLSILNQRRTFKRKEFEPHFISLTLISQHFYQYQLPWVRFRRYQHVHAMR